LATHAPHAFADPGRSMLGLLARVRSRARGGSLDPRPRSLRSPASRSTDACGKRDLLRIRVRKGTKYVMALHAPSAWLALLPLPVAFAALAAGAPPGAGLFP